MSRFEEALIKLCREQIVASRKYLRAVGADDPSDDLYEAARRVVWARYYNGDDGWNRLKEAIGTLEDIVGRPEREAPP